MRCIKRLPGPCELTRTSTLLARSVVLMTRAEASVGWEAAMISSGSRRRIRGAVRACCCKEGHSNSAAARSPQPSSRRAAIPRSYRE